MTTDHDTLNVLISILLRTVCPIKFTQVLFCFDYSFISCCIHILYLAIFVNDVSPIKVQNNYCPQTSELPLMWMWYVDQYQTTMRSKARNVCTKLRIRRIRNIFSIWGFFVDWIRELNVFNLPIGCSRPNDFTYTMHPKNCALRSPSVAFCCVFDFGLCYPHTSLAQG